MKIGILGGGQLARMLILAGMPLGCEFVIYASAVSTSTQDLGKTIIGDFNISKALDQFIQQVDVITFENENIPVEFIQYIERKKNVYPGLKVLKAAQDRVLEKQCFKQLDIPTNQHHPINSDNDLEHACQHLGYPLIVKSRREGYDGKHQKIIQSEQDIKEFSGKDNLDLIAEEFISFEREISMIGVRNLQGEVAYYDVCENQHQNGILRETKNNKTDPMSEQAQQYVGRILKHFNYVGTLAVEFFVQANKLLANEMAPRVHNSGHWTIEGACASQFENHIRAICGLPLGNTASIGSSLMTNCIGELPSLAGSLKTPGLHFHDYRKAPRAGRKLGHMTLITK